LRNAARLLSAIAIGTTLLPLSTTGRAWVRIWDFPRIHLAALNALSLIAMRKWTKGGALDSGIAAGLVGCGAYQLRKILPYTPLHPKQVMCSEQSVRERRIRLLTYNLYMINRHAADVQRMLQRADPDIICLLEPDKWWQEKMRPRWSNDGQEPVPPKELMKGYEYAPEQYVVFKDDELRQLRPKTSPDMQILRSVRLSEIDPVYFETSYYVVPDRAGERAYALLFAALKKTQYVALAKLAMHGREHIMVLRPGVQGILAHTMYYRDEIRAENEYPANMSVVDAKALELATTFVEAIAGPFTPEAFKDTYRAEVQSLISGKIKREEVAASGTPAESARAPVADMIEALNRSSVDLEGSDPA
jgi:DNA end-binding protein Ku